MSNQKRTVNIATIISPNWDANYYSKNGPKDGKSPCLICGKGVNQSNAHWVNVDCTTNEVVEGILTDHFEYGLEPIGADCFRRNKTLLQGMEVVEVEVTK